jgi:hypothetical protein
MTLRLSDERRMMLIFTVGTDWHSTEKLLTAFKDLANAARWGRGQERVRVALAVAKPLGGSLRKCLAVSVVYLPHPSERADLPDSGDVYEDIDEPRHVSL